ncbi:Polynucleotide 5'-hydroxyl-kinase NOL9 [Stylophora pistillata]|uniref:Polynucleotide 5'-hydroxyl-kinase NOL9 n=1 Tax=Stylophora pistillata TaxID=50429 RepID=A0A2B4SKS4_STYPI|nr:Polynucleotide 5'-hydroxyl-kinase NOL9 [Stylophora pistillata]
MVKPSHIIQFNYTTEENIIKNMPAITEEFLMNTPGWAFTDDADDVIGHENNQRSKFRPSDQRSLALLAYFSRIVSNNTINEAREGPPAVNITALMSCIPYQIPWNCVAVHVIHTEVPWDQILFSINASVVGLAKIETDEMHGIGDKNNTPFFLAESLVAECIGLGIVRNIDPGRKLLHVLTPLTLDRLQQVNALLKGNIEIPAVIMLSGIILLQFLLFDGVRYSVVAQVPDDTETWKGSNRIIALEDIHPFEKKKELRWVPGFMCGWTPYGLCFSPEWKRNIHYYFIIPFKNLYIDVYVDQPADPAVFGINSVVLTRFKQKPGYLWEGLVTTYWNGWDSKRKRTVPTSIQVRTDYHDLKEQLTEWFSPSQLRLKGAFDACKYLETNCQAGERCVSRRLSGYVWPGQYKCVCKDKGFLEIRGQGCFDVDECQKSPCGALSVCVNTFGSYKCNCKSGYEGKDCKTGKKADVQMVVD